MSTHEKIQSLRKFASKLPKSQKSNCYKIHWICNELDRVRSGKLNHEELLAFFQHLARMINRNSEDISE